MDIKSDEYTIYYDLESKTVFFQGILWLNGIEEYQQIIDLLNQAVEETSAFTLDLRRSVCCRCLRCKCVRNLTCS